MDIAEVYTNLKNNILENRNVTVVPKTIISDLFMTPTATEVTKLKIIASFIAGLQSFESMTDMLDNEDFLGQVSEAFNVTIDDVTILVSGALDKLAANYNKTRKVAVAATGVANFYRPNPPSGSELSLTIPVGTTIYTDAGVEYQVTTAASYSNFYYDDDLSAYVVDASIECTTAGVIGNAPLDTIINLRNAVSGFGDVTNSVALSNGIDIESDANFATRMKNEISGTNVGTPNGIKSVVLQNTDVSDAIIVKADDPDMYRDHGWGGAVDVYVLETNPTETTWTFTYQGEDVTYIEGNRPLSLGQTVKTSTGSLTFTPDILSYEARSVESRDYVTWTTKPSVGESVTLTYFYDKNIADVQTLLDSDDYNTGADVLVKQSTQVPIDIVCQVVTLTGYAKATIQEEITTTLTTNISELRLGENLEQSDVISWITAIDGVDRVVLPLSKFNRSSLTGVVDVIEVESKEYIRLNNLQVS